MSTRDRTMTESWIPRHHLALPRRSRVMEMGVLTVTETQLLVPRLEAVGLLLVEVARRLVPMAEGLAWKQVVRTDRPPLADLKA
jgi:hypothetical protein